MTTREIDIYLCNNGIFAQNFKWLNGKMYGFVLYNASGEKHFLADKLMDKIGFEYVATLIKNDSNDCVGENYTAIHRYRKKK